MGRKSLYRPEMAGMAFKLKKEGYFDKDIMKALGINKDTFYLYQTKYPDFAEALKKGEDFVIDKIEESLYQTAKGYFIEEQVTEIKYVGDKEYKMVRKIKKYIPPNIGAQIFILKNKRPDQWKDTQEHKHTGQMTVLSIPEEIE